MSRLTGIWGEAQVASYLRKKGYQILAHGYRCRFGEIDLVASKDDVVCFVEVKTRSSVEHGLPREAVTPQKQEKLRKTASFYLSANEMINRARFDVAEVYTDKKHNPFSVRIEYIENAF
jgi:putative endonuclease